MIVEAEQVTSFDKVKKCVMKQIGGSFIFGDLRHDLWKRMMLQVIDSFVTNCFKLLRPVRNIGYQLHLLVDKNGINRWQSENVEGFFNPAVGIIGIDGKPKKNPQTIFDPSVFPSDQHFGNV